jgi:diguanylate cyclase (GGDEF)-like protein
MLDIDNFKQTNDRLGHLEGDKALQRMAGILTATFRHGDIIGRLGGDEFLVFAKGLCDRDSITRRVELLLKTLRGDEALPLYSSVGITLVRPEDFRYTRSLREADTALYRSKNAGKDGFSFFEPLK